MSIGIIQPQKQGDRLAGMFGSWGSFAGPKESQASVQSGQTNGTPPPAPVENRMDGDFAPSQAPAQTTGSASNGPSAIDRRMQQIDHAQVLQGGMQALDNYPELKKTFGPALKDAYQQTQIG